MRLADGESCQESRRPTPNIPCHAGAVGDTCVPHMSLAPRLRNWGLGHVQEKLERQIRLAGAGHLW